MIEERYGVSKSTAYYHASDNREAYDNQARKVKELEMQKIKQRIFQLIEEGLNTGEISAEWNMPLAIVNKIYTK